jgi:hypothetical protein
MLRWLALGLALAGCGSESSPASPSGGAAGQAGAGGQAGGAGSGGSAGQAPCSEDPSTLPAGATCVLDVKGRLVNATGAPIAALSTSVCGSVCFYGESDATGAFSVSLGAQVVPSAYSTLPHGRPDRTSSYFPLPEPAPAHIDMGDLLVLDLPASGPLLTVKTDKLGAPAQSVTSNGVTFDVPAGVAIKLDVEDLALGDAGKQFRALPIDAGVRDQFADPKLGLIALYALTPFEAAMQDETTGAEATASLSLPNSSGLSAGTKVEFLALGSYLFPGWVAPAAYEVVATGSVSSDGSRLEMDAGQGVRYVTWIGARPAP